MNFGIEVAFNTANQVLLHQYIQLIQWHDHPTGQAESIDGFRRAVSDDYRPGTGYQSAEEFLTAVFNHEIMASVRNLFTFTSVETREC